MASKNAAKDQLVRSLAKKTKLNAKDVSLVLDALGAGAVLSRARKELGSTRIDASSVGLYVRRGKRVRNLVVTAGRASGAATTVMV